MNKYRVKLWPEKAKSETINLEASLHTVLSIAEEYNKDGRRATNKKWIEENSVIVGKDYIELILCSEMWLNFPTKALRGFISKLSKTEDYQHLITDGGRLFKGDSEYIEEDTLDNELTDEQAMTEIVKLFFRENEINRKKINIIKAVLGGKYNE